MLKSKQNILVLMTLLMMIFTSFGLQLRANAVFDDKNFNVTWNTGNATIGGSEKGSMNNSFTKIIEKYKTVITFVSAVGAVTMVAIFIINFMKLGTTSGNPTERSKCIGALIWSGLAAAGLGSVALVVGIFYGALKD